MNLLDIYTPKQLALKTMQDISERRKLRTRDINDYRYKAMEKSISRRRKRS